MVFGKKTVSWMEGVAVVLFGDVNDLFNVEVGCCTRALELHR